jgi:ferritin-like metal-binding protein YciE
MADQSTGDAKLAQYLTEAHGKETELIQSLAAHIEIAQRPVYKKRLKDHLRETKNHAKLVERRIKKLGGDPDNPILSRAATAAAGAPKLAAAAVKGAGHALRGTGEEEKQLKNAKTEYFNEHEEIANYTAIEALATELGDKETAKVAKQIRREEERMASFLEKQIPILTKAVAKAEVPKADRKPAPSRRSPSRASSTGKAKPAAKRTAAKAKPAAKRAAAKAKPAAKRRTPAKKK